MDKSWTVWRETKLWDGRVIKWLDGEVWVDWHAADLKVLREFGLPLEWARPKWPG